MKIEFFILKEIQITYRNKDSFVVKKCCNFIPFEILDHGNASRIKIIFYVICHVCRWVQSPVLDIGCFCKEWHLEKNPPNADKTYMYMPITFHKILHNALKSGAIVRAQWLRSTGTGVRTRQMTGFFFNLWDGMLYATSICFL